MKTARATVVPAPGEAMLDFDRDVPDGRLGAPMSLPVFRRSLASAGGRNFAWLVAEKFARFGLGVAVGFWVARYLGPSSFGQLGSAISTIAFGLVIAECGIDALVRRELLKDPARARSWLRFSWRARLIAGVACYGVLLLGLPWLAGDAAERWLLAVLALQLFQPALGVGDIWLQANLQAGSAFRAQWFVLLLGAVARLLAVAGRAPLVVFAAIFVAENLAGAALVSRRAFPRVPAETDGHSPLEFLPLLRAAAPLVVSGIAITVYMRIDLVMLPHLANPAEAGLFAAAVRISEFGYFIPMALAASLLPAILASREAGPERHAAFLQRYFDASALAAVGLAAPLAIGAPWIIRLAYGPEFAGSAPVLAIHAWAMVFVFLGVARSQFLLNEQLTRFYLAATLVGAVVNVGLNLVLIPRYGACGAAVATVAGQAAAAWMTSYFHPAVRAVGRHQGAALFFPLAAWRLVRAR